MISFSFVTFSATWFYSWTNKLLSDFENVFFCDNIHVNDKIHLFVAFAEKDAVERMRIG